MIMAIILFKKVLFYFKYAIKFRKDQRILHILFIIGAKIKHNLWHFLKNFIDIRIVYYSSYQNTTETHYLLLQSHSHVFQDLSSALLTIL